MNYRSIAAIHHTRMIHRAKQQITALQASYHSLTDVSSRKRNIQAQARNYRSIYEQEEKLVTLGKWYH